MRMGDTESRERSWRGLKDRAHHTYSPSSSLLHIKLLPYLLPPESTELQYPADTERGRTSADFPTTVACWHQRWKRAALNLCVCRSPCHDSPFLVHLVKPSRSSQSASQPLSQRHPSVFTCVSRPAGSPAARRRGFKRDAPLRPHTEWRKVRLWALMTLYLHVTRMISVLQHSSPPTPLPLSLTCSQAYAMASQLFFFFFFFLQEALYTAQRAAARLDRR